ncbi:hypothetical protein VNI00_015317 [Paramarasmius palmivorus]|uniref:F-box domain-containing protein n=1 Tax=Paramarasmius palmivorus TaxID=297713 RepID=A0AAW0BKB4_9AGAR
MLHISGFIGSNNAPDEEDPWRDLPLAALPIAIDIEADTVDILNVLPYDLAESIIDMCSGDKETMKSCSLVCREWTHRSRFHLLEMSCIRVNRVNAGAFVSLLESPHFALRKIPYMELSFRGESSPVSEGVVPLLVKQRVVIRSLVMVADTLAEGSCRKSFPHLASIGKASLTELSLRNHLPDKLFDILQFIYSFPRLEKLSFTGVYRGLVSPSKLPARLREFSFINGRSRGTDQVLHWLISPKAPSLPCLSTLVVDGITDADISTVQKLLDATRNHLRYLDLRHVHIHDVVLHFEKLRYLQRLVIHPHIHSLQSSPIQFIKKMLLTISAYNLKEIELHLPHIQIPHLDESQCRCLDDAFTLPQLSDVERLTIKTNYTASVLLSETFATCQSKGIFNLVVGGS